MPAQSPSTNIANLIDVGNCIVYVGIKQSSFANCASYTGWRKLGLLKDGAQLTSAKDKLEFFSGTPLKKQKAFFIKEDLKLAGTFLEFSSANLNRALGNPGQTITTKVSPSTTIKTATVPTVSSFNLTSPTGFAVDKEIEVTSGTTKQYGTIKSIVGDLVTLYEGLDLNTVPAVGDAVKVVDTKAIVLGSVAAPGDVALKISKTLVGGYGSLDIYMPDVQANGNITLAWADATTNVDGVGIPFEFEAISDPAVESGNLAQVLFTQA